MPDATWQSPPLSIALLGLLDCLCRPALASKPSWLECAYSKEWHAIRTNLNNVIREYGVQGLLKEPLGEEVSDDETLINLVQYGDIKNPWTHIAALFNHLTALRLYDDPDCPLGRWAGLALSCALFPDAATYISLLRRFHQFIRDAFMPVVITESGWPVWALLDLVIARCRLKRVRIGGVLPIMMAAWGPMSPLNGSSSFGLLNDTEANDVAARTALADAMGAAAKLLLQVPHARDSAHAGFGFGLTFAESELIDQAGRVLASQVDKEPTLAHSGLPVDHMTTSRVVAAGAPLWKLLALLQDLRFFRADCPGNCMLVSTIKVPDFASHRLCLRFGRRHPIDRFIWQVGFFPDCMEVVKEAGAPEAPGIDVALDVGANIGACAIPLGLLGYRVVAFEPQALEAKMLLASAVANEMMSPGKQNFAVLQSLVSNTTGPRKVLQAHFAEGQMHGPKAEPMWVGMMVRPAVFSNVNPEGLGMKAVSELSVASVRLDDFASERPDLLSPHTLKVLKVDAEAGEAEVFAGAESLLRASAAAARGRVRHGRKLQRPIVLFEYVPQTLEALGLDPIAPLQLLSSFGYVLARDGEELAPDTFQEFAVKFQGGNLKAWPKVD